MPESAIPDTHHFLLELPILAHFATIGPRGEAQVNPVWFLWDGTNIVVFIDHDGQKAKNIARDPRVSMSLAAPQFPDHYLEIRGLASFDQQVGNDDPTLLAIVRKYTGNDSYPGMPDTHARYLVEPSRATSMG